MITPPGKSSPYDPRPSSPPVSPPAYNEGPENDTSISFVPQPRSPLQPQGTYSVAGGQRPITQYSVFAPEPLSSSNTTSPEAFTSPRNLPNDKVVTSQPPATQPMALMGGPRNAKRIPMRADGREWSHGLCDCCADTKTCWFACCCPCVVHAQNKRRLEHLMRTNQPDPEAGGGCCSSDCWVHGTINVCCALGWVMLIAPRGSIRARYQIRGGGCGDCCVALCCTPCGLTQESRELQLEEDSLRASS